MRFTPISVLYFLALVTLPRTATAAERFRIDPDHTFVHFAVLHTGVLFGTRTDRRHQGKRDALIRGTICSRRSTVLLSS